MITMYELNAEYLTKLEELANELKISVGSTSSRKRSILSLQVTDRKRCPCCGEIHLRETTICFPCRRRLRSVDYGERVARAVAEAVFDGPVKLTEVSPPPPAPRLGPSPSPSSPPPFPEDAASDSSSEDTEEVVEDPSEKAVSTLTPDQQTTLIHLYAFRRLRHLREINPFDLAVYREVNPVVQFTYLYCHGNYARMGSVQAVRVYLRKVLWDQNQFVVELPLVNIRYKLNFLNPKLKFYIHKKTDEAFKTVE
jgi:hypothetical protein